jgi:hypothetical protein
MAKKDATPALAEARNQIGFMHNHLVEGRCTDALDRLMDASAYVQLAQCIENKRLDRPQAMLNRAQAAYRLTCALGRGRKTKRARRTWIRRGLPRM